MQSYDERIDVIREAVNNVKDNTELDLNNVSFAAISDSDNSELTSITKDWVKVNQVKNIKITFCSIIAFNIIKLYNW